MALTAPACSLRVAALSVASQVKSLSSRPKWPYAAGLAVDRTTQIQAFDDALGGELEVLANQVLKLLGFHLAGTEGID